MKKSLLLCAMAASCTASAFAQTNYSGNLNTSFGGAIGNGTLSLSDNGSTLTGTLTKGNGDLFDDAVIYIDSVAGGVTSTSSLTDTGDVGRESVSGYNGTNRAAINFSAGFGADYAITFTGNGGTGSLYNLTNTGNFSFVSGINFSDAANPGTAPTKTTPVDTFSISLADIGLVPGAGQSLSFITTYLNGSDAFRSGESIGNDYTNTTFDANGNVGRNTATINMANVYATEAIGGVPEPGTMTLGTVTCLGLFGLHLRRRRQA